MRRIRCRLHGRPKWRAVAACGDPRASSTDPVGVNTVTLAKVGPGQTRSYRGANRVNLFRVFFRRTMKDGNFIIEVEPGLYELEGFSTSGWGQPRTWNAKEEARKGMRVLVTRPGLRAGIVGGDEPKHQ